MVDIYVNTVDTVREIYSNAFATYKIVFTNVGGLLCRNRYYEFFKATHFLAAMIFVVFFFIHCDFRLTSWDYFIATAVLYTLAWGYGQCRTYMEHGLYRKAQLFLVSDQSLKIEIETDAEWTPGQHVFLRFLTLGVHALTAHPFTICSIPRHGKGHNRMVFYIEPRGGFSSDTNTGNAWL